MANKYINAICKCPVHGSVNKEICCPTYGATDSETDQKIRSAGLGMLMGAVMLVALPFIFMGSANK